MSRGMTSPRLSLLALLLALPGCGGPSSLTTAAVQPAPVPANDATARALQVGAVSARASRCGFHFDPTRLKAAFLADELRQGASADQLHRIEREYEFTRLTIAGKIAKDPDYCSEGTAALIKADLARHLAGDFTPTPPKAQAQDKGVLAALGDLGSGDAKPFSSESIFGERGEPIGRRR
jgi:hypothetical protein